MPLIDNESNQPKPVKYQHMIHARGHVAGWRGMDLDDGTFLRQVSVVRITSFWWLWQCIVWIPYAHSCCLADALNPQYNESYFVFQKGEIENKPTKKKIGLVSAHLIHNLLCFSRDSIRAMHEPNPHFKMTLEWIFLNLGWNIYQGRDYGGRLASCFWCDAQSITL